MNELNFCYWLQGFFEIGNNITISEKQLKEIKNHLKLCLTPTTPLTGGGNLLNYTSVNRVSGVALGTTFGNNYSDTYITITKNPAWASGQYSSYQGGNEFCSYINENFKLNLDNNTKIVIDNNLKPKYSPSNKLSANANTNHMVGTHDNAPGLVNMGTGPTAYC